MSAHTPGPWEAVGTAVYAETPNGSREIIFSRHNTRSGMEEERRANAVLIAAAPEMLETLRLCYQLAAGMRGSVAAQQILLATDATIARANGRV